MVNKLIVIACLLAGSLSAAAQQILNIFTTTKGVVSFSFADQPQITFPSPEVLTVTSKDMTVEFPYAEVEKINFNDADANAIASLTVRDNISQVLIYDLTGKLVRKTAATNGSASVNLSTLRPGVYVVKDGRRSYKVKKQ
ncbi:MAG: T9SS type A sorting domain-containing protein [Bacteroidaceae bacterium]|nr:T9SS type A sorting domain-containing protein [Bacteroidaceae bacterium]